MRVRQRSAACRPALHPRAVAPSPVGCWPARLLSAGRAAWGSRLLMPLAVGDGGPVGHKNFIYARISKFFDFRSNS